MKVLLPIWGNAGETYCKSANLRQWRRREMERTSAICPCLPMRSKSQPLLTEKPTLAYRRAKPPVSRCDMACFSRQYGLFQNARPNALQLTESLAVSKDNPYCCLLPKKCRWRRVSMGSWGIWAACDIHKTETTRATGELSRCPCRLCSTQEQAVYFA